MTNRKDNPKNTKYVFRPSTTTIELVAMYLETQGCTKTRALEDLIQLGGTVFLQRMYKDDE